MLKKGIVTIFEMIAAVIILFTAFSIFFPGFFYQSRWNEAILLLKGRDFLLTLDRSNLLYNFSFNQGALSDFALKILEPNLIAFVETEGLLKGEITIACNCTSQQIGNLSSIGRLKLNDREIFLTFLKVDDLNNIPPSDALLIWGYKPLSSYYNSLLNYLQKGSGIIEIMDFRYQSVGNPVNDDIVQTNIFGLSWIGIDRDTVEYVEFNRTPTTFKDPISGPYKYFYNFPQISKIKSSEGIANCNFNPSGKGFIFFNNTSYAYWICNSTSVWFDSNGDGTRDKLVDLLSDSRFVLSSNNYNFTLNYIEDNSSIHFSFKPIFKFNDFLGYVAPPGEPEPPGRALGTYRVYFIKPGDDNWNRVLLKGVSKSPPIEYPASIVNITSGNRVAWLADIQGDANDDFGDDKKQLVLSLLLWASSKIYKQPLIGNVKTGYITPYINIVNKDILEVYRINLGLGFPY
ncbi:MAG: hypothetical protein QXQ18_00635 [Candidatus Aenigmatarchaeota archaeon]